VTQHGQDDYTSIDLDCIRDPAYDPFIPKASVQDQKTARVQRQVDDVMNVMKENIEKVQERGMKMDVLKEKAGKNIQQIKTRDFS
jgi:hypothetical protein